MRELAREGMTMVVVTHEMGFARDAATRVIFLDRGRVVETAPPDRLLRRSPQTERVAAVPAALCRQPQRRRYGRSTRE